MAKRWVIPPKKRPEEIQTLSDVVVNPGAAMEEIIRLRRALADLQAALNPNLDLSKPEPPQESTP